MAFQKKVSALRSLHKAYQQATAETQDMGRFCPHQPNSKLPRRKVDLNNYLRLPGSKRRRSETCAQLATTVNLKEHPRRLVCIWKSE
jgi:hypothetical protein